MPYRLIDPATSPRLRTVLHVVGGLATGILFVGVIFLVVQIYTLTDAVRETQVTNVERADVDRARDERTAATAGDAARAAERIEDCTTPGRRCFEESQERLGRTVGTINRYALAAAACADRPGVQTITELEDCILAEITRQRSPEDR